MDANTAFTLVLGLPLVASPIVYLVGRLWARQNGSSSNANPARWLAILALLAAGVFTYFAGVGATATYTGITLTFGDLSLTMDGLGLFLTVTVLALGLMATLYSTKYMEATVGEEKFYALLVAMIGAIIGLGCATDVFNMWLWFELMAVTSYFLVAFYRDQKASLEAGIKYLVQSATGSTLVMLGLALTFAATGTMRFDLLRQAAQSANPLLLAAGALFVIGFGVKSALVPLHTWLPDAHSQAPSGISAMLSGIVIEAGLVAMLRSLSCLYATSTSHIWGILLLVFGALNLLVGNLMALRQTEVKRLLAYSSVSQVGYMLLGFGMAFTYGAADGAVGGFFHLFNHALMKGLAFLAAGALLYALYIANDRHGALTLNDLNGASRRYPVTAFCLSLAVLALGGLPPLAGFMSKWQIFASGFETGNTVAIALVIFAALNSVLSLGYYAPMVNRLYRNEPSQTVLEGKPISAWMAAPMILLALAIVVIGVWPSLLTELTSRAALSLFLLMGG
ncbi:membrane bound hydrogenase subunit mbhH [Longilinea arvoryzae]|uniref:Membrane bound hydrogenase subunit mbhH n=1 Tax=Longilinea arvoryzae TaxID=360412 RepID=A0A0S7BMG5_9CHLR|nr:complex I subunit 5 family protein [Longilinea arvoryzae]GAP15448.1 membrane bound hydrogenase subunit mbhH [Longilinea arvoryzae]